MKHYPIAEPDIGPSEVQYVTDALRSGWVSSRGKYVDDFEREFAAYCGKPYGVAVASGTAALHLALSSLGIGPGDEVVIPALTYVATASVVLYLRAIPVVVDVEPQSWCLDPQGLEQAITARTKAVIPVHIYGQPADLDAIAQVVEGRAISIVEDAAQAHGATYKGHKVGGFYQAGAFSFYGNKSLTTGEGGMMITSDGQLASRARYLRNHGAAGGRHYWHTELGYSYRLTNLQAALGLAQLHRLDRIIAHKRAILARYREQLGDLEGISFNPKRSWSEASCWLCCILVPSAAMRDSLAESLQAAGVDARPFFHPINRLPALKGQLKEGNGAHCAVAEDLAARGLCLPSGPKLELEEVTAVAGIVRRAWLEFRG